MNFDRACEIMSSGLAERIFTGAVLKVDLSGKSIFHRAFGNLGDPGTARVTLDTLFDLASLTKVLATTPCWMILAAKTPGILDRKLSSWIPHCPADKADITPRQLLAHSSGLPAWRPFYLTGFDKNVGHTVLRMILKEQLEYHPGKGCIYSDLGFILLAFLIEMEVSVTMEQFIQKSVYGPLGLLDDLMFRLQDRETRIALTRHGDPAGLVNDLNCRALGGVAGHAGLFGTATGVAALAEEYRRSFIATNEGLFDQNITHEFFARTTYLEGSTRALGFDTPSIHGSSSGSLFSRRSIGHTGFTGTSLWIDLQQGLTVTLLTNRVIMGEADQRIKVFRPLLHDAVIKAVQGA